ncbi:MerR family transcriptional regulator [Candidatus Enterococcus ferrettii]|uniref:HTH merR-type domain-containing protein n=1 Tax=Candidatus Enterococcus ferrettii TaxID=2815324 RepID=A0ABV0EPG8_9ENTE|nr:MerR family transcriptional regulator [Enterococcus sp. 665A]MBO1343138.1 MerR family transcriptional regulator [Enterococcus sp. 665A]
MKQEDVSRQYQIPVEILKEYESWGLCDVVKIVMGEWQYDDQDLERLSTIMALHDLDFSHDEIETYMRLLLEEEQGEEKRMKLLTAKRQKKLADIHLEEKKLQRIDYLRHVIKKNQTK